MKRLCHIIACPKLLGALCLMLILTIFTSCDKPKSIPDTTLVSIVGDLYLANAYWDMHGSYAFEKDSMDVYTPIFEHYGYTPEDFMYTIEGLTKRKSLKFSDVLQAALDTLDAKGRPTFQAVARRDTLNRIASELYKKEVYSALESQRYSRLSRAQDSPAIKIPVEAGKYKIEWICHIDSTDQNPYVQYMQCLTDQDGKKSDYLYRSYTKGTKNAESATLIVKEGKGSQWLNVYPAYTTLRENQQYTTKVTIDSLRITRYPTQEQIRDSIQARFLYNLPLIPPQQYDTLTKDFLPFALDTTGVSTLGDTLVRR